MIEINKWVIAFYRKILRGEGWTFIMLAAISAMIMVMLLFTVHNRNNEELTANVPPRYMQLISFWHDYGYIKHGGLWIWQDEKKWTPPKNDEGVKYVYRSLSAGYLFVPYVLEQLYHLVTGHFSVRLMCWYNQLLILLSSSLLGFLAFSLAKEMQLKRRFCLCSAITVLAVHQIFPVNLKYYWETYPTTVTPTFVILILICMCRLSHTLRASRLWLWIKCLAIFLLVHIDFATAFMFIPFLLFFNFIFAQKEKQNIILTVLLPSFLALCLMGLQFLIITLNYPDIQFVGSGPLFRTGFDGSVLYYNSHWDIIFSKIRSRNFLQYPVLLISAIIAFLLVLWRTRFENKLHLPLLVCYCSIGLFVPFAFVFSQAVTIHPYAYDSYLLIPVVLLFFCVGPAMIEKMLRQKGYVISLFMLIGFCYCMVFMRDYAKAYPLNNSLQDHRYGYSVQSK